MIRGALVHKTIQDFFSLKAKDCKGYDFTDLKIVIYNLFKHTWQTRKKTFDQINITQSEQDFYFSQSLPMLYNFMETIYFNRDLGDTIPMVEKNLQSKKLKLKGRVDAIFKPQRGPPLILDFKTSQSMDMSLEYIRQLGVYALLYHETYNIIPDIGVHFLRFKKGLQKYSIKKQFLKFIKTLVKDVYNRTRSTDIADYPCVCDRCHHKYNHLI
jgi:CRISPR/Cas system-associated exonuclease Cas4 (RecB family)